MADTQTPNYDLVKPEIDQSRDTWGIKLNANMDKIDEAIKGVDNKKPDRLFAKSVGFKATTAAPAGDKTQPIIIHDDATEVPIVTLKMVQDALAALLPHRAVIMWNGPVSSIPAGWALCDGSNGTPNLRDRFVVGAGLSTDPASNYNPGDVGGGTAHSHTGVTGGTVLTTAQIPAHGHNVNDPGHSHFVVDQGHAHNVSEMAIQPGGNVLQGGPGYSTIMATRPTSTVLTGITIGGSHTGISIAQNGGGQGHNHPIVSADHRPPYYALCFIMKLAPATT